MPASRVAVDDADTYEIAAVPGDYEGRVEVVLVNRGPNSIFIDDSDPVSAAADSFEVAINEGLSKNLGKNEGIYGICDTGGTAVVHVFRDDID
jgi:hypothetical protein